MKLEDIYEEVKNKSGQELFGDLGEEHPDFKAWRIVCHPDKNDGSDLSRDCFKLLGERANECKEKIITISSKKFSYEVNNKPIAVGDISRIYVSKDRKLALKVAENEKYSKYMENEDKVLKHINKANFGKIRGTVPNIENSFTIFSRKGPKKKVNVFGYEDGFVSLREVRNKNPSGVNERNFGWIMKRVLSSLAITHELGYVHGCLTPDNYLVHKLDHRGKLIDFIHSVVFKKIIKSKTKDKIFYPTEILKGTAVSQETDIFMAGKLGIYLLGGNPHTNWLPNEVNKNFVNFLSAMTIYKQSRRPNDAWELHQDLDFILYKVFGPPKYEKLTGV